MSKVILTTEFVERLGALFGEDFTRRGIDMVNDTKGLFVEAFISATKAEHLDDECEYITVDEEKAIAFFTPESHYQVVNAEDLRPGDCIIRGKPGDHRIVTVTCRVDHESHVSFMFDGEGEQTYQRNQRLWKV